MSPADSWGALLVTFACVFTSPSYDIFLRLATGWVLCPGRHTVTGVYQQAEPSGERAHDAYHRFLRAGAWSMSLLWQELARLLVAFFYATGVIPLDLDDTVFHKTGRKVEGAGWWRDAVRSTGGHVVHGFGLNLVVLTLRVEPPWGGEPLGLPINLRVHRKGGPSLLDLAVEMVTEVTGWLPERDFKLCADGFYASLAGRRPARVHFTSCMRRDAALYAAPPTRKPGTPGRPRKKGRRLPTPEQLARSKTGWRRVVLTIRGKQQERLLWATPVLWYETCPDQLVLLIISRDPKGIERDDFLFTTDPTTSSEQEVTSYGGRWSIEDTFRNTKQHVRGQEPQSWKNLGPERAAAFSFWLYSVIWLWYVQTCGVSRTWPTLAWYTRKARPSFVDALATLRKALWHSSFSGKSETPRADLVKMINALIDALARAT